MAFQPINLIEKKGATVADYSAWRQNYKEAFVEHPHDVSQLDLVLPDDCLLVVGPPRLQYANNTNAATMFAVGFVTNMSINESRNVAPVKAIGSRRHIFSATNNPVQISFERMLLLGMNTLRTIYANAQFGSDIVNRNSKFESDGKGVNMSSWIMNVEEDIFRVPIGLGIIYNSPASLASNNGNHVAGAEYCEVCVLQGRQISVQSGQTIVAEQVSLFADRIVPWPGAGTQLTRSDTHRKQPTMSIGNMDGTLGGRTA